VRRCGPGQQLTGSADSVDSVAFARAALARMPAACSTVAYRVSLLDLRELSGDVGAPVSGGRFLH
jgi:hypothetical protein